jgi:transglutaminase-like putative cysteine protease
MTPGEQLERLASVAAALGCTVRHDRKAGALEVQAPDLQTKVELLHAVAEVSSHDALVASVAMMLRACWPLDDEFALGVPRWVASTIRWIEEPGERFQLARVTLESCRGDCDCSAALVAAIFLAAGMEAEVRGYERNGNGIHAAAAVKVAGVWRHAEATNPAARLGDDPAVLLEQGMIR